MEQLEIKEEISGGIFFQYTNSVVLVLAGFIFYVYLIHFYNSELVGTVALLTAIVNLVGMSFPFGLGNGVQHFISYYLGRHEYETISGMIVKFFLIGLLLSSLSLFFLYFMAPVLAMLFFHTFKYVLLIRLLGIDLFFSVLNTILVGILLGLQNFRIQAVWNIIAVSLTYSLPIILLLSFHSATMIVIGWALGNMIASLAYSLLIMKRLRSIPGRNYSFKMNPAFAYSIPVFLSSLMGVGASYVDRFVVSYLMNLSLLGIYNFALLISSAISFLIAPFGTILLPKLSEMYGSNRIEEMREYVSKGIELVSAIYVPVALLVSALSSSVLLLLSSREYLPATLPITIVLLTSSLFVSANILSVSLMSIRKTRIFLLTSSIAFISNFAISFSLIPKYQMIGASIGYSSISVVTFLVVYYYARKYKILKFPVVKIAKIYLSAFVMFFAVLEAQRMFSYSPLKLFAYIAMGFAIYSLLIKLLRTFSSQDLDFIMLLIPRFLQKVKGAIVLLFL